MSTKNAEKAHEANKALKEQTDELNKKSAELENDIAVSKINKQTEYNDETNKLALDLLHQRQSNADANRAILDETEKYASEIQNLKISELKDSQDKEIQLLNKNIADKLLALDKEAAISKQKLDLQRKEIALDVTSDPAVLALKKQGLDQEVKLEEDAAIKRAELRKTILEAGLVSEQNIKEKYAQQAAEFEYQTQLILLNIKKQDAATQKEITDKTAEHEIAAVEQSVKDKIVSEQDGADRIKALKEKQVADVNAINLQGALDEIDLEKLKNQNLINSMGKFSTDAVANVNIKNKLIAQAEANAAWQRVEAMRQAGVDENTLAFQQAYQTALSAQEGLKKANAGKSGKTTWADILGFSGQDANDVNMAIDQGLKATQKLLNSVTQDIINNYQKQIDAKKAVIASDDSALADLQTQLKTEQDLKNKGYANNVDGIQKEIAAKQVQRDKDAASAAEYQKKMEKVQKAQIIVNSIEEASQLTLAAAKILSSTAIAVPVGIAMVAAMIAAFVAEKALSTIIRSQIYPIAV